MVVSTTPNRIQQTILEKIEQKGRSVKDMCMVMEETETEVAILNTNINSIKSRNGNITPKTSIKYLGYYLQSNLKIDKTVDALLSRINQMAGRIWQFPCMPVKCKVTLYYAYVHSLLMSNAACILPFLTSKQP